MRFPDVTGIIAKTQKKMLQDMVKGHYKAGWQGSQHWRNTSNESIQEKWIIVDWNR